MAGRRLGSRRQLVATEVAMVEILSVGKPRGLLKLLFKTGSFSPCRENLAL